MSAYVVDQDSVITSLFVENNSKFLTCGGTNIAPKSGAWDNFTALNPTTNFKYIFNGQDFISGGVKPAVTGYSSTGTAPLKIKQFLYNSGNIEYICGQFSVTVSTVPSIIIATNIMYFNPLAPGDPANLNRSGIATFNSCSISFNGADNIVNCMKFLNLTPEGINTNKLVIAGKFTSAVASGTSRGNIAILDVDTTPSWTINILAQPVADAIINALTTTINSIIVIDNIIYVAGSDDTNCLFYSYNTTTNLWSDLLGGAYVGTINILKKATTKTNKYIAIGGEFTNLGVSNCNNIVLYDTVDNTWTALGTTTLGVTEVPASSPIYPSPEVFALEYNESNYILWVGGYFLKAGGNDSNSIAFYDITNNTWNIIQRNKDSANIKGLLLDSGGSKPGVVYALYISAGDTSNIVVGGSFRTSTTPISPLTTSVTIYNLVKITTAATNGTKRNYVKFNSKCQ